MSIPGYGGEILHIDLTAKSVLTKELDESLVQQFVGGFGINNKLAYDLIPLNVEPFSPENVIIIGAGVFDDTGIPASSKTFITTKFPINGAFATGIGGGFFSHMLKSCGYDHVIITGRAPNPVFIRISDNAVEMKNAGYLWGKDAHETDDLLRKEYEPCSIIPIGQAGENLVRISLTYVDNLSTIGSGGLPAVMGSKNLKAIVAQQGSKPIRIADRNRLSRIVNNIYERIENWPDRIRRRDVLIGLTSERVQGFLIPNERRVTQFEYHDTKWKEIYMNKLIDLHRKDRKFVSCASCPFACKSVTTVHHGELAGMKIYGHARGLDFHSDDPLEEYTRRLKFISALDGYGICAHNFAEMFFLLIYLYEKNLLTTKDTGGLELVDSFETAMKLVEIVALKQGEFGNLLADGYEAILRKAGLNSDDWIGLHRGRALAGPDPRLTGMATLHFGWITNPRGVHTGMSFSPTYSPGRPKDRMARTSELLGIPPDAIERIYYPDPINIGRLTKWAEDWSVLLDLVGLCLGAISRFYSLNIIVELYSALTGIEVNSAYFSKVVERVWAVYKLLNYGAGFRRKDDSVPRIWLEPLKTENGEFHLMDYHRRVNLTKEDVERYLEDYYDERGYDRETGMPTPEKLTELQLEL